MAVTNASQAFFIVWTTKDMLIEVIPFDHEHWVKVSTNLDVFFKSYVAPAILNIKSLCKV